MKRASLLFIRTYQKTGSKLFGLVGGCRFEPSCSQYGYQSIERFGFWRGWGMALGRIGRCSPWGGHGHDPVPEVYVPWRRRKDWRRAYATEHREQHALETAARLARTEPPKSPLTFAIKAPMPVKLPVQERTIS